MIHDDEQGLERLIFFSDAVFAIAITLLALDIRLPAVEGGLTDEALLQSLLAIWPKYLSYVISFLVIGSFWIAHHKKFSMIRRYDITLMFVNLLLLLVIAFMPFPTAIVSEYGNRTATIFYALTMTVAGLLSALISWYAMRGDRLVMERLSPAQKRRHLLIVLITPLIFLLSIGVAFIDDDLAKLSWLLIAPVSRYIR